MSVMVFRDVGGRGVRRLSWLLLRLAMALLAIVSSAKDSRLPERALHPGEGQREATAKGRAMPPGLRGAYIAAVQADAPRAYAVELSRGVWRATNAAQRFTAEFTAAGLTILPHDAALAKRWSLAPSRYGCDGALEPVAAATPEVADNRVEYRRGDSSGAGLEEFYVNGPLGLEQGFTLSAPPLCRAQGSRGLVIELALGGEIAPVLVGDGSAIDLHDSASGAVVSRYTDLHVSDARGRELPARLSVAGQRIALQVDDAEGTYPLRVDPLIWGPQTKLVASDPVARSYGTAVATSDGTIAIGAPFEENPFGGAVYIFQWQDTWVRTQKIVSSDGAPGDEFGVSLAIASGKLLVGAPKHSEKINDNDVAESGAAYLFERYGGTWYEQLKLTPDGGPSAGEHYGAAVAMGEDGFTVVGAPDNGEKGKASGAVYVFGYSAPKDEPQVWPFQRKFAPDDAADGDHFGKSVAMAEDNVIVGAPDKDGGAGAAYGLRREIQMDAILWSPKPTRIAAGDLVAGDHFGAAVAAVNDTAVVSAPDREMSAGAVYLFNHSKDASNQDQWSPAGTLAPPAGAAGDSFGAAIAARSYIIVGAPGHVVRGRKAGMAYGFRRDDSGVWVPFDTIASTDAEEVVSFGAAVATFDEDILIGAPAGAPGTEGLGSAQLFAQQDSFVWPKQRFTRTNGEGGSRLGLSVAISGDTAVVGAPYDDELGLDAGSAYVFVRSAGGGWTQEAKLQARERGREGASFGVSVAIDKDVIVVGAPHEDEQGVDSGAAYVFKRSKDHWLLHARIGPNDAGQGSYFGAAVAVSELTVAVGVPGYDKRPENADVVNDVGKVFIFVEDGADWSKQFELSPDDAAAGDHFGASVALSGDTAVVGAPTANSQGEGSGAAYVFFRQGISWSEQSKLLPKDLAAGDQLGTSVALSGDTAVVGAPSHDSKTAEDTGAAYVFLRTGQTWAPRGQLLPDATGAGLMFGISVAVAGDTAVVGAPSSAAPQTDLGAAYSFRLGEGGWSLEDVLKPNDGATGTGFGISVAMSGGVVLVGAPRSADRGIDSGAAYVLGHGLAEGETCEESTECARGVCSSGICCATGDCASLYSCATAPRPLAERREGSLAALAALTLSLYARRRSARGRRQKQGQARSVAQPASASASVSPPGMS